MRRSGLALTVLVVAACSGARPLPAADERPAREEPPAVQAEPVAPPQPAPASPAPLPDATGRVRVVVRDFAGAPVAGARVVAQTPRPRQFGSWPGTEAATALDGWRALPPEWKLAVRADAATGADGSATLSPLDAGRWEVAIDAPGRVRRGVVREVKLGDAASEATIIAEKGHPLAGRVVSDDGSPVAKAIVLATYPPIAADGRVSAPRAWDFAMTVTDAVGAFRFDALPDAYVALQCGPPGAWSSHVWAVRVPSVTSIDLRLPPRNTIEGTVRGEPDGDPIAGADVIFSVATWHTAQVTAHATTDASGRYRIPVYPGTGVNGISVVAPDRWSVPRVVDARQPPFRVGPGPTTHLDLAARRDAPEFAAVRGVVRGPDGPVAGAEVFLASNDGEPWSSPTTRTDGSGRFWFLDAPPRRLALILNEAPGLYQPGKPEVFGDEGSARDDPTRPWWIAADAPRPVDVEMALLRGGRVSGRVVDEAGRPFAGAVVFGPDGLRSASRDDGTFVLEGLAEPEELSIAAEGQGGALEGRSATFRAGAGADAEGIVVTLRAAPAKTRRITVRGRARPSDEARSTSGGFVVADGVWVPLAADGTFRFETETAARGGEVSFDCVVPGWGSATAKVKVPLDGVEADAGNVNVDEYGRIRGRVDHEGGPVAGAVLRIEPRDHSGVIGCSIGEDPDPPVVAVTKADGTFEASGLVAGEYTLHVSAPGFIEGTEDVDVASGATSECSPTLAAEARLRGRVIHRDGRPAAGASVDVEPASGGGSRFEWTDGEGLFDVRVAKGSTYVVEVSSVTDEPGDRFLRRKAGPFEPDGDAVEIVVEDGAAIAGRVVSADGKPVAGAELSAEAGGADDAETTSADDGTFSLTALATGAWTLTVKHGLEEPVVMEDVEAGRKDVVIKLGASSDIEGTLLDESGKPAAGRTLVASHDDEDDERKLRTTTGADGRFRLTGVGKAACRIEIASAYRWEGDLPLVGGAAVAPGTKDAVLRMPSREATTIRGRVVGEEGKPFPGAELTVRVRPLMSFGHHCEQSGYEFDAKNLRLDAPCPIEVKCAGKTWTLLVPAGTQDLVITCGADGLRGATAGGKPLSATLGKKKEHEEDDEEEEEGR